MQRGLAVRLLLLLQPLRLLLQLRLEPLVFLGPVDEEPGEALAQQRREHGDAQDQESVGPHSDEVKLEGFGVRKPGMRPYTIYNTRWRQQASRESELRPAPSGVGQVKGSSPFLLPAGSHLSKNNNIAPGSELGLSR